MTDQELNKIEERARVSIMLGDKVVNIVDALRSGAAHFHEDVQRLIAEVRQVKAERDILAERVCRAQCWDQSRTRGCIKPLEDCKNCWLEFARKEAEKTSSV